MDLMFFNFYVALLVSIHQGFVSCYSAQDLSYYLNILLSSYKDGWLQINNVEGTIKLQNGDTYNFSSQTLYNEEVTEINAKSKFAMTVTLLGCKYMDVLLKFLNLIEHYANYCKLLRRQGHNLTADFFRVIDCHNSMFMSFVEFKTFDIMYGALIYLNSLYAGEESFTTEFIANVFILKTYAEEKNNTYPIKDLKDNISKMYMTKLSKDIVAFLNFHVDFNRRALLTNNCTFSDNHQQTLKEFLIEYKTHNPKSPRKLITVYLNKLMKGLQKEVIYNGFYNLGFMYDKDTKKTYVPNILRGIELEQMLLDLISV